jgi:hypothetical protein
MKVFGPFRAICKGFLKIISWTGAKWGKESDLGAAFD